MRQILVADDDVSIRKSFVLALEDSGCRVDTAAAGNDCIELARKVRYDLICLDLRMPGMTGIETLRQIRTFDPGVPVCLVTAYHQDFDMELEAARAEGLDFEVLKKPLDAGQIEALVGKRL